MRDFQQRARFPRVGALFLKLSAFEKPLLDWVNQQTHWRPNVLNFTRRFLEDGLKDRAITRDLTWGVPIPLDGYEGKRIYVWFEAVSGYLSAAVEWAKLHGDGKAGKPSGRTRTPRPTTSSAKTTYRSIPSSGRPF